jgi:uncharacterized protein YcbX
MAAVVAQLWRFPVKSFQGEKVERLEVDARGVVGDRDWALIDRRTGKLLSAKRHARLFEATAATVDGEVVIRLPDGTELAATDPGASDATSRWLGLDVELRHVDAGVQVGYEMTFDPPHDDAEYIEIPAPPGSFRDLAHLHLVSTATLDGVATARPDLDWDVRRFRPNVVVDLEAGAGAFAEDGWSGGDVALGAVRAHVDMPTVRCAMPLRAQPGLERQARLYDALEEIHANHLGVYATVVAGGPLAVGDEVTPV